jgi:malate permease and related proteins
MFGLGWIFDRRFRIDLDTLVKLNIQLLVPAFMFVHVVGANLDGGLAIRVMLFTACIIGTMYGIAAMLGKVARYDRAQVRSLQLATMFYNSGNYGVPLMALAYPGLGPLLQVFVILVQNVSCFSVGLFLANSTHRSGWHAILPTLRQASLWAVGAALLTRGFHIPVQEWRWLWVPLEYMSSALVAVALFTLGVQLSKTPHRRPGGRILWALGLRLIGGPLLAWLIAPLFGFQGEIRNIMIVSASFPTAVNTALLAHEFKADSEFATTAVFYSTIASMLSVTVLVALMRSL